MILIDSNVLVALVDSDDQLHARSRSDFLRLANRRFFTTSVILAEAFFRLRRLDQRQRLRGLLGRLATEPIDPEPSRAVWEEIMDWSEKFADQKPDFADALTVLLSGRERRLKVWTYDSEFASVWRRADGTRVPLAVRP
jgi:predicted nucleic acid-binding protein